MDIMIVVLMILSVVGIALSFKLIRRYLDKYDFGIYYINKEEEQAMAEEMDLNLIDYSNSMDLRGTPTHVCVCGNEIFNLKVVFEDFEIATYFLDMECSKCGSLATAPTPMDREIKEE
jgi:hypothetical protein